MIASSTTRPPTGRFAATVAAATRGCSGTVSSSGTSGGSAAPGWHDLAAARARQLVGQSPEHRPDVAREADRRGVDPADLAGVVVHLDQGGVRPDRRGVGVVVGTNARTPASRTTSCRSRARRIRSFSGGSIPRYAGWSIGKSSRSFMGAW